MPTPRAPAAVLAILCAVTAARGAILPRPSVDRLCQDAPVIVEGRPDGAALRVETVFRGAERLGARTDRIDVPALPGLLRVTGDAWDAPEERERLAGERVVLFLSPRDGGGFEPLHVVRAVDADGRRADGAAGVVWIEAGRTYAYRQTINPGPYVLHPAGPHDATWLPADAQALREALVDGVRRAGLWTSAAGLADPAARAAALAAWLDPARSPDGARDTRVRDVPDALAACGAAAVEPLARILREVTSPGHRAAALRAAGRLGSSAAPLVPLVTPALADREEDAFVDAIRALGAIGSRDGAAALRALLDDTRFFVVVEVAQALAAIGDAGSFDALAARLPADPAADAAGRVADVLHALERLDHERALPLLDRYIALPAMASTVRYLRSVRAGEYRR